MFLSISVHAAQGNAVGQIDLSQYNCGNLGATECILQKLDQIQQQVGCPLDEFQKDNSTCNYAPAEVTATFCISQGRGVDLGAEWAIGAPIEWEGGLGWAEVADAKATWAPSHPLLIPGPGLIPVPLPTEASLAFGAGLGRGFDICVELPVAMLQDDEDLLEALVRDINVRDATGQVERGKFQRRGSRLLNYTKRRVPGVQTRSIVNSSYEVVALNNGFAADDEFDRLDEAMESLMTNGLTAEGNGLGVFRDPGVVALSTSFDQLPKDLGSIIRDPEQIFDGMENFSSNLNDLDCELFGVTTQLRAEKPGLDRLCSRLEELPDFETVQQILSGEFVDGIVGALDPLLANISAPTSPEDAKTVFCSSEVGQRRVFNRYCGR
jgi:hypothetical protein